MLMHSSTSNIIMKPIAMNNTFQLALTSKAIPIL